MATIDIYRAEELVKDMANNEKIEDRAYEMAQELVNRYIHKVAKENRIIDVNGDFRDGDDNDEMWYDEVREDTMKIVFERLADFFRGYE